MIFYLVFIFNIFTISKASQYGENYNSCVDSCTNDFEFKYSINLDTGKSELKDGQLIEILDEDFDSSTNLTNNILLRIPFSNLKNETIVKIELEYGDFIEGTTIHIGNSPTNDLYGGDRNTTIFNTEIYSIGSNFHYYMSTLYMCDQGVNDDLVISQEQISRLLFLNESTSLLNPKAKVVIYIAEKWFRVDNIDKKTSLYYNNKYLFSFNENKQDQCKEYSNLNSPFLYIGLNRVIADSQISPGKGIIMAKISFLNCFINGEPDMKINVKDMRYTYGDGESLFWTSPLNYLEPADDHTPCSAQGVVKVKFDSASSRKVARFDLEFGEDISGYSFNIGDSQTNNAFGGDAGSTSNSAEIHSNGNQFYIWLNTKYCGDTLLYKIEYNLLESYDNLTIFISDERIEIKNSRGFHQIYKNQYLYQLNNQNVTCNCFDTRCYPGVKADNDIYFSINRVIGGSFRPGVGLCQAKISWLQCSANFKNDETLSVETYNVLTKRHLKNDIKRRPLLISSSFATLNQNSSNF